MIKKKNYSFRLEKKNVFWSVKYFSFAIIVAFILSIAMYSVMLLVSEPAYVDEAIITTASAAVAKVEITAEYINPMWSLFIFNSIAVFSAVIGTSLFPFIHPMMIGEIELRSKHPVYAHCSIVIEKMMMPANRLIQKLVTIADRDFPSIRTKPEDDTDSMWKNCGYEKVDYHKFAYILPYTVPVMIILVNGFLIGILMAFFTFNGALTGFQIFGTKGILIGIIYNLIYFVISILPHGIIELPVILVAAALGYRFAFVQSHEVKNENLFLGDTIEIAKTDVAQVIEITKNYMSSLYVWKMLAIMIFMLLIAAYIEINVTGNVVESTMNLLDGFIEKQIA
jgi:uncharacterized membrane protein SpoIIM required for sporulation